MDFVKASRLEVRSFVYMLDFIVLRNKGKQIGSFFSQVE